MQQFIAILLYNRYTIDSKVNTRRTEILADDNKNNLINILLKAPRYAMLLYESCDIVDSADRRCQFCELFRH